MTKPVDKMTMQELHDHCLGPDHNGPAVLTQMGASGPKRWHFLQHKRELNHNHNGQ